MSNIEEVNKSQNYFKAIYLSLILLCILCLFFPFKIIHEIPGYYMNILGFRNYHSGSVRTVIGFKFPPAYGALVLMLITSALALYSKKKVGRILSLVLLGIYLIYLLIVHAAINFKFNLFGPSIKIEIGFGFYILLIVSALFTILSIVTFIKTQGLKPKNEFQEDLLDDIN